MKTKKEIKEYLKSLNKEIEKTKDILSVAEYLMEREEISIHITDMLSQKKVLEWVLDE